MRYQSEGDRRTRRTKSLLHRALASLLHEKPWDEIAVKEILARADVGRSTFYTHFADKDALLTSGLRETLRTASRDGRPAQNPRERVLDFSLPLLEHIDAVRSAGGSGLSVNDYAPLHTGLLPALVDLITDDLHQVTADVRAPSVPLELVARQLASTFFLTLEWWIALPQRRPARDADQVFHALAGPVVDAYYAR